MNLFTCQREKRPWIFVIIIVIAIYSTLELALNMAGFLQNQEFLTVLYLMGTLFVNRTIVKQGFKITPG